MNDGRTYNSPSREQGKSETREGIIAAVVAVINEQGIHAFTMQTVAEAAGVSHRTVYRHFESREALLEGLSASLYERTLAAGLPPPEDVSKWPAYVGPLFELFFRLGDAMRASVVAAVALGHQTEQQRETWGFMQRALNARFPHLPESELRGAAAVLRTIISRYCWYVVAIDLQLTAEEAGRSASWALSALLRDLERRDAAAVKRPAKSSAKAPKPSAKTKVQR